MSTEYCTYCGAPRGDRLSCCQENHFMTAREYRAYHGDWPDDGEDHDSDPSHSPPICCSHCGGIGGLLVMQGGEWWHFDRSCQKEVKNG